MSPTPWMRDEIESPCVQLCQIHPETSLCLGCARTLEEIARWSSMSDQERKEIYADLTSRSPAPTERRGGRKARLERAKSSDQSKT